MNTFLSTVASQFTDPKTLESALVVFPTKRAGLFFSEVLGSHFEQTIWLPEISTLDELAARISNTSALDANAQVFTLFNIYRKLVPEAETISRFFTWGSMLLSDFNDIDASLADAEKVLEYVGSIKEIDLRFEGLEPEQLEHLKMFWNSIHVSDNSEITEEKQRFLAFWQQLPNLYKLYSEKCESLKAGARGFRLKKAVEKLEAGSWSDAHQYKTIIIAGFNQLTKAEERLICLLIEKHNAKVVWDFNPWYLQMQGAEVSQYYNRYKKHYLLSETLPKFAETDLIIPETKTNTYVCGGLTEEIKLTANLIRELSYDTAFQKVAVIIPDGSYLIPLLHAIPKEIKTINVTLQFPFKQTTLYSFLQSYIKLKESGKSQFETPELLSFLRNAYVRALEPTVKDIIAAIVKEQPQHIYATQFNNGSKLSEILFSKVTQPSQVFDLLFGLLNSLVTPNISTDWFKNSFEEQFYHIAYHQLTSLQEVLNTYDSGVEAYDVWRLALQVLGGAQIPFLGEPLIGLQIMQLRETMTLDFDTVFILGANEGNLPPKFQSRGSFVPYNLRKAFGLPLPEQLSANFAYQFFRLISRSKQAHILYSVGSDDNSNNEPTRFLGQLKYLLDFPITHSALSTTVGTAKIPSITVPKTAEIIAKLKERYITPEKGGISPSAINELLECSLRFYLHRVAYIREPDEVAIGMNAATIGTFFHESIEAGYKPFEGKGLILQEADFEQVKKLAFSAFNQKIEAHFGVPVNEVKGESILTIALIKNYLTKVIAADAKLTDLQIVAQEAQKPLFLPLTLNDGSTYTILINGKIDRIDRVGDTLRIIDYKTGKDELSSPTLEGLFDRTAKKSTKAIMQVFVYALMYLQDSNTNFELGIYKLAEILSPSYDPNKGYKINIKDYEENMPFTPEYLNRFRGLMAERLATLFDINKPFTQTTNTDNCKYCEFKPMCGR